MGRALTSGGGAQEVRAKLFDAAVKEDLEKAKEELEALKAALAAKDAALQKLREQLRTLQGQLDNSSPTKSLAGARCRPFSCAPLPAAKCKEHADPYP